MRKVINEPGFWLMVFGVIIIAMLLFAGDGDCDEAVVNPPVDSESITPVENVEETLDVESEEEATYLLLLIKYIRSGGM